MQPRNGNKSLFLALPSLPPILCRPPSGWAQCKPYQIRRKKSSGMIPRVLPVEQEQEQEHHFDVFELPACSLARFFSFLTLYIVPSGRSARACVCVRMCDSKNNERDRTSPPTPNGTHVIVMRGNSFGETYSASRKDQEERPVVRDSDKPMRTASGAEEVTVMKSTLHRFGSVFPAVPAAV